MKNIILSTLIWFVGYHCTINAHTPEQILQDAVQTKNYLVKTTRLTGVAHMCVKQTKNYSGDLALAVRHQRKAIELFQAKAYEQAIYHSKRCRVLCIKIFNDNKIKQPWDAKFTAEEELMASKSPRETELDNALPSSELKDQDLINGNLMVDVK
jgi:hypothetical protein